MATKLREKYLNFFKRDKRYGPLFKEKYDLIPYKKED